jgi:hypothetical protein
MAVHVETDWRSFNLFAGAGLALPGYAGSPLRNPSLASGFRYYTKRGTTASPYLTGMYGWSLRSAGIEPFAGAGAGIAWHFGPERSYRLAMEADLLMRGDSFAPFPTAGFGLAVRL